MSAIPPAISEIYSKAYVCMRAGTIKSAQVAGEALSYIRCVYWLSLFAQSIIEGIKQLHEPARITKSLTAQKFAYINKGFLSYMDGILVFVDLKDIVLPDEKGRWFWEHHWQFMSEKISWAAAHGFDFGGFLQFVGSVKMDSSTISGLSYAAVVFKVIGCVWGIWDRSRSILHNEVKRKRACELKAVWASRSNEWSSRNEDCEQKIKNYADKLLNPKCKNREKNSIQRKLDKWNALKSCVDENKIKLFCSLSSKRDAKKIYKYDTKLIHSIVSILYNASLISLVALTIIARFTKLGTNFQVKMALIALPVSFTALELGHLTLQKIMKVKSVPKLNVKDLLSV